MKALSGSQDSPKESFNILIYSIKVIRSLSNTRKKKPHVFPHLFIYHDSRFYKRVKVDCKDNHNLRSEHTLFFQGSNHSNIH